MKPLALLLFLASIISSDVSAAIDTISIYSQSMRRDVSCVVITPKKARKLRKPLPVVYLLHGYSGDQSNWVKQVPAIDSLSRAYNIIIVCPDGGPSSWYLDSPVDSNYRYETFIAKELTEAIDNRYKTIRSTQGRAITGLSMGGFGALFITFRHPTVFGAAGSMSGALNIEQLRTRYELSKRIGDTSNTKNLYREWSVINLLENIRPNTGAFIIDCGIADPFIEMNRAMHSKMLAFKVPHDYIERPGGHDWPYWRNAVTYQLQYFHQWMKRNKIVH